MQLVSSSQARNLPGRPKTDKEDARWIARLTEMGMLRSSFVPPPQIRALRVYTRHIRAGDRRRVVPIGEHRQDPPAAPVPKAWRAQPYPGRRAGPRPRLARAVASQVLTAPGARRRRERYRPTVGDPRATPSKGARHGSRDAYAAPAHTALGSRLAVAGSDGIMLLSGMPARARRVWRRIAAGCCRHKVALS